MSDASSVDAASGTDPVTMLSNVYKFLQQCDPTLENVSYSYSTENSLPPSWLIQSAPDDTSSQLLETIQHNFQTLVQDVPSKTHFIDITQMGNNNPDDAFQSQMIASISAIAKAGVQKVVIRYLEGNPAGSSEGNDMTFIDHLKEAYAGPQSNVYFYAASFVIPWEVPIPGLPGSWTHAKMIAIDGVTSIAGGQNYWNDYLPGHRPPHDVSIQVNGAAAVAAHHFANALWSYIGGPNRSEFIYNKTLHLGSPDFDQSLPPAFEANLYPAPPTQPDAVPVLAVGNLGLWLPGELKTLEAEAYSVLANPEAQVSPKDTYLVVEEAINALLYFPFYSNDAESAKATQSSTSARHLLLQQVEQDGHIRISQQKIADTDMVGIPITNNRGGVPWPGQFMQAIVSAMKVKNATVDIIVSFWQGGPNPVDGYSDDMGAKALRGVIVDLLAKTYSGEIGNARMQAEKLASKLLTVKATTEANHAKIWIVDDKVFYVGSDNIYPAYLQEFGYVVGSTEKTQEFIQNYWTPMWNIAKVPPVAS